MNFFQWIGVVTIVLLLCRTAFELVCSGWAWWLRKAVKTEREVLALKHERELVREIPMRSVPQPASMAGIKSWDGVAR